MASKIFIITLSIILTIGIVSAAVYYTQFSPSSLNPEKSQVFTVNSVSMEPTILVGNKILVDKQADFSSLNINYPDSDIIVYYSPSGDSFFISRIVAKEENNGTLVYRTKGDSNMVTKYPDVPSSGEYDPWEVTEDMFFGIVIDTNYK